MAASSGRPDLTPPRHPGAVARGLEQRRRSPWNRRRLSPGSTRRMTAYFQRHAVDKIASSFGDGNDPLAGHVVRLLRGGGPGWGRANRMARALDDA